MSASLFSLFPERSPAMSRNGLRDLLHFFCAALLTGVVASVLLVVVSLLLAGNAHAQSVPTFAGDDPQYVYQAMDGLCVNVVDEFFVQQ